MAVNVNTLLERAAAFSESHNSKRLHGVCGQSETEPKLVMPFYPRRDKEGEIPYNLVTRPEKLVMDYCHIDIYEVQDMEIDVYLFFMREAMIFENSKTDEGREYLKNCWRMEQTRPDREGIRKKFKKKGG